MTNKIRASYKQLKDIVLSSDTGIHLVDKNGITIFYNSAAERIDQIKSEEILGASMYDLVKDGTFSQSVAIEVLDKKEVTNISQKVNNKQVIAKGIPIFYDDVLEYVIVYTRDIETLKELSYQLKKIMEENRKMANVLSKYESKYMTEKALIHNSKEMDRIIRLAKRVSSLESPVFIQGEQGTGKTLFAHYLHETSGRLEEPFLKFDCSAIPDSIIEMELFGHEKFTTTGESLGMQKGFLESANNGTIFIDEIADMPLACQSKLLTFIETGKITPIGSNDYIELDIRVISASNENLSKLTQEGKFRKDLYYKLNVIPITIPPLRNRREDIMPLIRLFLDKFNDFYSLEKTISPRASKMLLDYHWPGNVRELENIIERLVVTSKGEITDTNVSENLQVNKIDFVEKSNFKDKVIEYEISLINYYASISDSIKDMSDKAQINESTLRKKIDRYNLDIDF